VNLELSLPFDRQYLSGSSGLIVSTVAARNAANGVTAGFYTAPFRIPANLDVSQPVRLFLLISPFVAPAAPGEIVRIRVAWTRLRPPTGTLTGEFLLDVALPFPWAFGDTITLELDDGSGAAFPAGALLPGDMIGFRPARFGGDAVDTFNQTLLIADTMTIRHTVT
jgi:hypothetical protein